MGKEAEALSKFGKLLMERVRDAAIRESDITAKEPPDSATYSKWLYDRVMQTFDPQQQELLRYLIPMVVDTTLHHLLWTLEQEESVDVSVHTDLGTVPSLRGVGDGMEGDLFEWIPKYSEEDYEWLEDFEEM